MNRRELILGGAALAMPAVARAQQDERVRRVGLLMNLAADDPESTARVTAFVQGLQEVGLTDGRNVRIDVRWSAADPELFRKHAAELAGLAPNVIVASTTSSVAALQQVTRQIPIVFVIVIDPVSAGFVSSLARPGGNVTGF